MAKPNTSKANPFAAPAPPAEQDDTTSTPAQDDAGEGEQPAPDTAPEEPQSDADIAPEQPAEQAEDGDGGDEGDDPDPIAELNAGLIAMAHPDGGTCDRYETDEAGNILVPVSDAAEMIDHGFVVVEG